ncbi:hypothetical protein J5N97_005367 [Dioscorea zingiberensis]|uniref:SWIB domain-containing protein n=1 Tax=Dioscorea zingiberensis TaxID=325984 RepID=A0A9D5D8G2_9LILI|nr:hypothetical protein J5N97_005367 [Dioscorea zingiberensis]
MVTDQEIASCVESLLRQAGPSAAATASVAGVRGSRARGQVWPRPLPQSILHPRPDPPPSLAPRPRPPKTPSPPRRPAISTPILLTPFAGAASASPFAHLPHHHDLTFRYPPPNAVAVSAPVTVSHQQQLPHPHVAVPRPEVAVGPLSPAVARPVVASPKESAPTPAKRKGGPGGLNKVCGVSPELQAIVGEPTMARTQIVKQLWAYIREKTISKIQQQKEDYLQ